MGTKGENSGFQGGIDNSQETRNIKVDENDLLGLYREDLAGYNELLTKKEFDELHRIFKKGELSKALLEHCPKSIDTEEQKENIKHGNEAFTKMLLHNVGLVISAAQSIFSNLSEDYSLMDLVEEGNIGLEKAIRCYDPDLGFSISTYANWKIRHEITRFVQNHPAPLRIPVGTLKQLMLIKKTLRELHLNIDSGLSNTEIAKIAEITQFNFDKVKDLLPFLECKSISLNEYSCVNQSENGIPVEELVDIGEKSPEDIVFDRMDSQVLREELMNLEPDLQNVIALHYGFFDGKRYKLSAIAEAMNKERQEVRALQARALYKLRRAAFKYKFDGEL